MEPTDVQAAINTTTAKNGNTLPCHIVNSFENDVKRRGHMEKNYKNNTLLDTLTYISRHYSKHLSNPIFSGRTNTSIRGFTLVRTETTVSSFWQTSLQNYTACFTKVTHKIQL